MLTGIGQSTLTHKAQMTNLSKLPWAIGFLNSEYTFPTIPQKISHLTQSTKITYENGTELYNQIVVKPVNGPLT